MKPSIKIGWLIALTVPLFLIGISIILESEVLGQRQKTPGKVVIKHIQNEYSPVNFDHSAHVSLATGCGQCHHMHNDKLNKTCRECHAIDSAHFKSSVKEGFLPCSACHTDNSADSPGLPGLKVALHKKCFECHIGIGDLGTSPQGCTKTCHKRNK